MSKHERVVLYAADLMPLTNDSKRTSYNLYNKIMAHFNLTLPARITVNHVAKYYSLELSEIKTILGL